MYKLTLYKYKVSLYYALVLMGPGAGTPRAREIQLLRRQNHMWGFIAAVTGHACAVHDIGMDAAFGGRSATADEVERLYRRPAERRGDVLGAMQFAGYEGTKRAAENERTWGQVF